MSGGTTDEELMTQYCKGDTRAFEMLYERHKAAVYRYILRHIGNRASADELYQDVWTNLIRARSRYSVKAKFTTFLYRIAHNRVVDHHRTRARRGEQLEAVPDEVRARADELNEPARRFDSERAVQRLNQLLAELPHEQREAFLLREEAGLSTAEIGALTGVGPETAKSRLRYAVAKLRRALEDEQ